MSSKSQDVFRVNVAARGSSQHLWNLLQGRIFLATNGVLIEELRESLDKLVGALTYFGGYEERKNEEAVTFPTAPVVFRSLVTGELIDISKKDEKEDQQPSPEQTGVQKRKSFSEAEQSSFEKISKGVAQHLKVTDDVATELVVSYITFEYKGTYLSYQEIANTQHSFIKFLLSLKEYYRKERLCLLFTIQSVLADLGIENRPFFEIIETFRSSLSFKKWCWGLLRSIAVAENDMEVIEILHCLILLMYKAPNESIPEFFKYLNSLGFDRIRKGEKLRMAEGAAMYVALVVSGITDCCSATIPQEFGGLIRDFISKNFDTLLVNPYNTAPLLAAYSLFCKEDPDITSKMRHLSYNTSTTLSKMVELVEYYAKDSLRDRHMVSLIFARSVFETLEALLIGFDMNHFGTGAEAFFVFAKILEHNIVAENFLCDRPVSLTSLYTEATTSFPLDIPCSLNFWKSLCMSIRSPDLTNTLVRGISRLNSIAECIDDDNTVYLRRLDVDKVGNLKARKIYGLNIPEGIAGICSQVGEHPCVVWELPHSFNVSAFDVLRWSIQPIAETLLEMKVVNASFGEYHRFDYASQDLHAVCEFVIQFWKSTDERVPEVDNLVHPICIISETMIKYSTHLEEKIVLIQDLLGIVAAINKFTADMALLNYIYKILPGGNQVSLLDEMILGRESVSTSKCEVTLAFLDMMLSFVKNEKCWKQGHDSMFEQQFLGAVRFISENILVSCSRWRVENEGVRLKLYIKCMEIFMHIYSLDGDYWLRLKEEHIQRMVSCDSCLLEILRTEEGAVQNSIITPNEDNRLLSKALSIGLQLLYKLIRFDGRIMQHVNNIFDGLLARILGAFVRHRFDPTIPTSAIRVLAEIAEKTTISLLACFGNDEAAFRDIIIQRLDFIGEDVNLKVAVLDFFTVISQTQCGILECFFLDGILENTIIDLFSEKNDNLAVACLDFCRSLFRQKLRMPRSRDDFWSQIFTPINNTQTGSKLDIITTTMHIITFDLYLNGLTDTKLSNELEKLFKNNKFSALIEIASAENSDNTVKCIASIKHFLTLILGRSELEKLIPKESLVHSQSVVLNLFWEADPQKDLQLCATLAELAIALTTSDSATPEFIQQFLSTLIGNINQHSLAVQHSLLCLVNKSFTKCTEPVQSADSENVFRTIRRVLETSARILVEEEEQAEQLYSIMNLCASLITTIVSKQHAGVWCGALQKEAITGILLHIASTGIFKKKANDVVANCLSTLISIGENPFGCKMISPSLVSLNLHPNLYKFTDDVIEESWLHIFLLCLNLNSVLLANLKHSFLDESMAFWAQYSGFLNHKLSVVAELADSCVNENIEKGYNDLKTMLLCTTIILNDVLTMVPYLEQWQSLHSAELFKTIRFVFYILQEVSGLLQQPFLLQVSVGMKPKGGATDVKLTPRVTEVQTKLWDIVDICTYILVRLKSKDQEFIEKPLLISTMFQLGQLAIKTLTKSDKKPQTPGSTVNSRYVTIMEKVILIVYNYVAPVMFDPMVDPKVQNALRRDMCIDVTSLCDGARRVSSFRNEFLTEICGKLDEKFK